MLPIPRRNCSCASLGPELPAPSNPEHTKLQSHSYSACSCLQDHSVCTHDPDSALWLLHTCPRLKNQSQHHCRLAHTQDQNSTVLNANASDSVFMATSHILACNTSSLLQGNQHARPQSCCHTASTGNPVSGSITAPQVLNIRHLALLWVPASWTWHKRNPLHRYPL